MSDDKVSRALFLQNLTARTNTALGLFVGGWEQWTSMLKVAMRSGDQEMVYALQVPQELEARFGWVIGSIVHTHMKHLHAEECKDECELETGGPSDGVETGDAGDEAGAGQGEDEEEEAHEETDDPGTVSGTGSTEEDEGGVILGGAKDEE